MTVQYPYDPDAPTEIIDVNELGLPREEGEPEEEEEEPETEDDYPTDHDQL